MLTCTIDGAPTTLTRTPGGTGAGRVEDFASADVSFFGFGYPGHSGARIGEILVYDRALDATESASVAAYLRSRFP